LPDARLNASPSTAGAHQSATAPDLPIRLLEPRRRYRAVYPVRACASIAVVTARNKARTIDAGVGQLSSSWVATLIEIVLVLGHAGLPSG
jgi:hypothetical protein